MEKREIRLLQGDKIRHNGFDGAIVRHYDGDMYEVRLPGGVCVADIQEIKVSELRHPDHIADVSEMV